MPAQWTLPLLLLTTMAASGQTTTDQPRAVKHPVLEHDVDPNVRWIVDPAEFRSKSTNTPFAGWELKGRADTVIVGGTVKFRRD
jgi:dihydroorotase